MMEADLKRDVVNALKASGFFYLRINSGIVKVKGGFMHLAPEGTSDFVVFPSGEVIWIELKAVGQATKKSRQIAQAEFRDLVLAQGHKHFVCTSVEAVMNAVKGYVCT